MSLAERVRRAMQELGEATARGVADNLGVQNRAQVEQVRKSLRDLLLAGEVEIESRTSGIRYRWLRRGTRTRGVKQEKLWGAMKVKMARGESFTAQDIALLAESNLDYAKRYLRFCVKQGVVMLHSRPGNLNHYQITPGRERLEAPAWNRREEERKIHESLSPCWSCQGHVKTIMGEMRQVLAAISGEAESVLEIIDEIEAGLPFCSQERISDGESADQPPQS